MIKNLGKNDGSYYSQDIWGAANEKISPYLKDGMTIYAEIVGYLNNGEYIQKEFDYGCEKGEFAVYIYRITTTSSSGVVYDWPWLHIKEFCKNHGLLHVPEIWSGKAINFIELPESLDYEPLDSSYEKDDIDINGRWRDLIFKNLKDKYLEKMCTMCKNKVPDEGIVLRIDDCIDFNVFKLKSFLFKEWESKSLDKEEKDIETDG